MTSPSQGTGLLDLLLRLARDNEGALEAALERMRERGAVGGEGSDELVELLKQIALDALIDLLDPSERTLLEASTQLISPLPEPASDAVQSWVRSRMIAYAKAMAKAS